MAGPVSVAIFHKSSKKLNQLTYSLNGKAFWKKTCKDQAGDTWCERSASWMCDDDGGSGWFGAFVSTFASSFMREHRETLLQEGLDAHGLSIREDSSRCAEYIDGGGELALNEVVACMIEMDYLCSKTEYALQRHAIRNELYQEAEAMANDAQRLLEGTGGFAAGVNDYKLPSSDDKASIFKLAKKRALQLHADQLGGVDALCHLAPPSLHEVIRECLALPRVPLDIASEYCAMQVTI